MYLFTFVVCPDTVFLYDVIQQFSNGNLVY